MAWATPRIGLRGSPLLINSLSWTPIRHASLTSAIERGIRKSQNLRGSPSRFPEPARSSPSRPRFQKPARNSFSKFDEDEFVRTGSFHGLPREHRDVRPPKPERVKLHKRKRGQDVHHPTDAVPERVKSEVKIPTSIPYTTPASEFIYGTGAVEAALRCSRRQLYKLYLYQGADEELSPAKIKIRKLALAKDIKIKMAFAKWVQLMDQMSAGRAHNGCILEVSPLPKLPVQSLRSVSAITDTHFRAELAPQTREEAAVNGTSDLIPILHPAPSTPEEQPRHRFPVMLLLDGVVDSGNVGAIIRSAYYLGIDGIVFAGRNSAPLSPVTIKASAGAAENMTMLYARNEVEFIQRSKENGWRFYAADAPTPGVPITHVDRLSMDGSQDSNGHPLAGAPSVLMMGSESSGLSAHIKSHADATVTIPGARHSVYLGVESDPARIDSLNVSVAAALLMDMFLQTRLAVSGPVKKQKMW
ncbi:tRNA/rRNA methyltransferase SpoU [Penicillium riverlandense]|uniref:tRNA/rRNA methyltransferase SpoU n=1 Tax=Penicillium riverlandense TaxID=1903569 RepID=UPI00254927B8|nr:tRNA/rRNA methyltransferase SpoU [Penicillium riverlandense]KAJ5814790.1 tRNA/rRNA methyltransferase SpoU [Penicillium riverlandense]